MRSTNILEQYLGAYADAIHEELIRADWKRTVSMATLHPSLMHIFSPQLVDEWMWDKALEYGILGNTIAQTQILSTPTFGEKSIVISESSFVDDTVSCHGFDQNTLLFYKTKLHSSNLPYLLC